VIVYFCSFLFSLPDVFAGFLKGHGKDSRIRDRLVEELVHLFTCLRVHGLKTCKGQNGGMNQSLAGTNNRSASLGVMAGAPMPFCKKLFGITLDKGEAQAEQVQCFINALFHCGAFYW
jgi:hypothetical protein